MSTVAPRPPPAVRPAPPGRPGAQGRTDGRRPWRRRFAALAWYWREFFGENAYDKYLVRHYLAHTHTRAVGLDHQPLSRRDFYRQLSDAAANVRGCC